jgi:hypothetical protein
MDKRQVQKLNALEPDSCGFLESRKLFLSSRIDSREQAGTTSAGT